MVNNLVDKIGDWNPQLLRELKGRLKVFPVAIAFATSLLLQLVVFLYQLREFPGDKYRITDIYCRLSKSFADQQNQLYRQQDFIYNQLSHAKKLKPLNSELVANLNSQILQNKKEINDLNNYLRDNYCPINQIDMALWWRDHYEYIFLSFSVIFIFTLLVAGTYMLINDLAKEENRGTLNFIRLSPQSASSIFTGKLLGVPILIYLFTVVAIPLHLWSGRSAKIALSYIFSYYLVLVASCIFFYSTALLFSLMTRWSSGFQPWLGSGTVLVLLLITMLMASNSSMSDLNDPMSALRLFIPWDITNYLFPNLFRLYQGSPLKKLELFNFLLGNNVVAIVGLHLFNYALSTYWVWQGLKRSFRNPNSSIFSKKQSYIIVAFSQVMLIGFTLNNIHKNLSSLALINFIIVLGLIAILSPHRQSIQDWARYRHQNSVHRRSSKLQSLWQDLIWDDKSPAIVAIAINLVIVSTPLLISIFLNDLRDLEKTKAVLAVVLFISMMMIYATISQWILLMKTPKRSFWAIGTIGAIICIPPMILQFLSITPSKNAPLWLFSSFPWEAIKYANQTTIFMAILAEFTALALFNFQLNKQIKLAGESSTQALLAGR